MGITEYWAHTGLGHQHADSVEAGVIPSQDGV